VRSILVAASLLFLLGWAGCLEPHSNHPADGSVAEMDASPAADDGGLLDAGTPDSGPEVGDAGPQTGDAGQVDAGQSDGGEACESDEKCPAGSVCEGCTPTMKKCVPGCHTPDQCGSQQTCVRQYCLVCPCPGVCVDACTDDNNCAAGHVCQCVDNNNPESGKICKPGCRTKLDCGANETCSPEVCIAPPGCPCARACIMR